MKKTISPHIDAGAVVRLREARTKDEWQVALVATHEADPETDRISTECPIGEALLGRRAGETVEVEVPAGVLRYRILSVSWPNLRAARNHP